MSKKLSVHQKVEDIGKEDSSSIAANDQKENGKKHGRPLRFELPNSMLLLTR